MGNGHHSCAGTGMTWHDTELFLSSGILEPDQNMGVSERRLPILRCCYVTKVFHLFNAKCNGSLESGANSSWYPIWSALFRWQDSSKILAQTVGGSACFPNLECLKWDTSIRNGQRKLGKGRWYQTRVTIWTTTEVWVRAESPGSDRYQTKCQPTAIQRVCRVWNLWLGWDDRHQFFESSTE